MIDFDRLFDLLAEADHGATCSCRVTTLAYLRLATAEWFRLVDEGRDGEERDRLRAAAVYIDTLVNRMSSFSKKAHTAQAFWVGFEAGWRHRTMPERTSPSYRRGYRFARPDDD